MVCEKSVSASSTPWKEGFPTQYALLRLQSLTAVTLGSGSLTSPFWKRGSKDRGPLWKSETVY